MPLGPYLGYIVFSSPIEYYVLGTVSRNEQNAAASDLSSFRIIPLRSFNICRVYICYQENGVL